MKTEIFEKLEQLRCQDYLCLMHGADHHQYKLGTPLQEETLTAIEKRLNIFLPEDYRMFLQNIGNGGAGPGFGISSIGNLKVKSSATQTSYSTSMSEKDWQNHLKLKSAEFCSYYHQRAAFSWNNPARFSLEFQLVESRINRDEDIPEDDEAYDKWYKKIEDEYLLVGNYPICEYGCNQTATLILTGPSKGLIWDIDWETNSIYNSETNFCQWYLNWLNDSLDKVKDRYSRFETDGMFWP